MTTTTPEQKLRRGIEAYSYEQAVLLRLLRFKGGEFSADDFDRWYQRPRRFMGRRKARYIPPETLILGWSEGSWSEWGLNLQLLQALIQLRKVTRRREGEKVIYCLATD